MLRFCNRRGIKMNIKQTSIVLAATALCAVVGSTAVSAQENCGFMYQRVMEAYQAQSPHYGQMLGHYNAHCLAGSSARQTWNGDHRRGYDRDRRGYSDDRDRRGYSDDHERRGW